MNEKGLIEQVSRVINSNYSNIYVIDINKDKVLSFGFTTTNSLVVKETMSYTDFIDIATRFVHKEELNDYFNALSLNKLEIESQRGNSETKVKYRKLCETGEYRWYVNIINYLPFEGAKLIFMMSEDVNERLTDSETESLKLSNEITTYKNRLANESESISDAIVQINNILDNSAATDSTIKMRDTKAYINSIFTSVSADHPELNKAIMSKMAESSSYKKPSILIVDDSSIIRNSLKRIFVDEFNIIMAKDGIEAMDIMKANMLSNSYNESREDITGVLLDLLMPDVDGFAVLEFMKQNNLFSRVPVAIISGDETRETRKKVYEYDISDMLEKPFNTDNIRRRITKLINLHRASNHLQRVVEVQSEELENNQKQNNNNIKDIILQVSHNVSESAEANKLKRMIRTLTLSLANRYPKYGITPTFIDNLVNSCALYNIGAIAIPDDTVITSQTITKEINYGLSIVDTVVLEATQRHVAENIVKYSCEMFDGTGYPTGIKGDAIPLEAQLTNVIVRLMQYTKAKTYATALKLITEKEKNKFNIDIIEALLDVKKELKEMSN